MEERPPSYYTPCREGGEQPRGGVGSRGPKKRRARCIVSTHDDEEASASSVPFNNRNDNKRKRRKAEDFEKLKRDLEEVNKVVLQHLDELSRYCGLNLATARTEILHKLECHLKKQSTTFSEEELEMALKLMPPHSTREAAQRVIIIPLQKYSYYTFIMMFTFSLFLKVLALKNELAKLRNRGFVDTTAAIDELFRRFDLLGIKHVGGKRPFSPSSTQPPNFYLPSSDAHESSRQLLLAQQQQLQMLRQRLERTKRQRQNDYDVGTSDHRFDFFASQSQEDISLQSSGFATSASPSRRSEPSSPLRAFTKRKRR